ncbi:MAG: DUF3368 domain-containing protein [Gammaproteobacteria bacterium]|nr:MAG: DUF3368 domain-containing protein [Gammaproteobacteria bacterium]
MTKIIVADTGPLIALSTLELLSELTQLFEEVYVPGAVIDEALCSKHKPGAAGIALALKQGWIKRSQVTQTATLKKLSLLLDAGESEALSLAKELGAIVLIDERKGRRVAKAHDIPIIGTAAVLVKAKRMGKIAYVKPLLEQLTEQGYRLNAQLVKHILIACDEK